MASLFLTLLLPVLVYADGQVQNLDCTMISPCSCKSIKGIIDLSTLQSNDPKKPAFLDVVSTDSFKYSFNPCKDFSEGSQGRVSDCQNVAGCQVSDEPAYYSLGSQNTARFVNDPGLGLNIEYVGMGSDNVNRKLHVVLYCDPKDEKGTLTATGQQGADPSYILKLSAKACCPVSQPIPPKPRTCRWTKFWIDLPVFFMFFVLMFPLYVIGTMIYCKLGTRAGLVSVSKSSKQSFKV